jgi:DNA-binding transcriptional MocR family regulator
VKVTCLEGGLFLWIELPLSINTTKLIYNALEKNVAYIPGEFFFANGGRTNTMRLNFSCSTEDQIVEGIQRLAKVIKEALTLSAK